jgi:hypothetical protein
MNWKTLYCRPNRRCKQKGFWVKDGSSWRGEEQPPMAERKFIAPCDNAAAG